MRCSFGGHEPLLPLTFWWRRAVLRPHTSLRRAAAISTCAPATNAFVSERTEARMMVPESPLQKPHLSTRFVRRRALSHAASRCGRSERGQRLGLHRCHGLHVIFAGELSPRPMNLSCPRCPRHCSSTDVNHLRSQSTRTIGRNMLVIHSRAHTGDTRCSQDRTKPPRVFLRRQRTYLTRWVCVLVR